MHCLGGEVVLGGWDEQIDPATDERPSSNSAKPCRGSGKSGCFGSQKRSSKLHLRCTSASSAAAMELAENRPELAPGTDAAAVAAARRRAQEDAVLLRLRRDAAALGGGGDTEAARAGSSGAVSNLATGAAAAACMGAGGACAAG